MGNHNLHPRYGGSKVRTGCVTCKSRHVKCGEEKPSCQRCLKSGRICEGYALQPRMGQRRTDLVIINYGAPKRTIPELPIKNLQALRSFEFFRCRTAPELSGCFSSDLWSVFLLRASHRELAIQHAVIAIGALHENLGNLHEPYTAASELAMQHYGLAIREILKLDMTTSREKVDVALMSCILFAALESLQGHYHSAMTHIFSGLKVLSEEPGSLQNTSDCYVPREQLMDIFIRLDNQTLELCDSTAGLRLVPPSDSVPEPRTPSSPTSVLQVTRAFDRYVNRLMHFFQKSRSYSPTIQAPADHELLKDGHKRMIKEFDAWCQDFDDLLAQERSQEHCGVDGMATASTHPGITVLRICRIITRVFLYLDVSAGEKGWDAHMEEFREVVDLARTFMNSITAEATSRESFSRSTNAPALTRNSGFIRLSPVNVPQSLDVLTKIDASKAFVKSPRTRPNFSLTLGILSPLYVVCTRCRDPVLRREALDILSTCNRKEGIWDSAIAATVAQRIIAVEEEAAIYANSLDSNFDGSLMSMVVTTADQIPEIARVEGLDTFFGPGRQGRMMYQKGRAVPTSVSGAQCIQIIEEHFEW